MLLISTLVLWILFIGACFAPPSPRNFCAFILTVLSVAAVVAFGGLWNLLVAVFCIWLLCCDIRAV